MTSTTTEVVRTPTHRSGYGAGLVIAVLSALAFGLSGSLARSLLNIGWSPAAIVSMRIGGAFVVLLVPSLILLRRLGRPTSAQGTRMLLYGAIAVGGAQLCYFSAVQYLSIGVALLLEYLAPVLLIGWHWMRSRQRPALPIFVGAGLSLVGLALVLDLSSGVRINPVGVLWGLGAAVCLCGYFILSEEQHATPSVHPLLLTTAGLGVGGLMVLAIGASGLLPLAAVATSTELAGAQLSWLVPALTLILVSGAFSYISGIVAVRRLGSSLASFVSLSEVIFAVVLAVILLDQQPSLTQVLGGALVLAGIVVVQRRS